MITTTYYINPISNTNYTDIRSNLRLVQNERFVMNLVYSGGSTMVATGVKSLDLRLSESPKNSLSRTFFSSKLSLQSWILHCIFDKFPGYPHDTTIQLLIIVFSIPQHISWLKNYKLYWFSNLFLVLLLLVSKQLVLFLTRTYSS